MTPSRLSDTERELYHLRARAYGPKPDIEADPAAIARLIELEAAHLGIVTAVNATEAVYSRTPDVSPSVPPASENVAIGPAAPQAKPMTPATSRESSGWPWWQRVTATRSRARLIVRSIVVVAIVLYAATWLLPRPDATLQPIEVDTDSPIFLTLNGNIEVRDISTLRQFEHYHDIDVWSVENSSGEACLIAWDTVSRRFEYQCLPRETELALHMNVEANDRFGFGEWLPDGSVISFHLRENTVDVVVHSPSATT